MNKTDIIRYVKYVMEEYEQFNERRTDNIIYHTDCLYDFMEFFERWLLNENP